MNDTSTPPRARKTPAAKAPTSAPAVTIDAAALDAATIDTVDVAAEVPPAPRTKAAKAAEAVKAEAKGFAGQAREKALGAASEGKARAAGAVTELGRLIEDSAVKIDSEFGSTYGDYARSAARTIEGFAEKLDAKDVEELLEDARSFVKKSPAVTIGAAAVAGFVLMRLIKSGNDNA